jgi:hypothetical protein
MIIQIDTPDTASLNQARQALSDLAGTWGHHVTGAATPAAASQDRSKNIDPVAIASLAVSLPSAALAVADLADRIRKRRRAADLISHARQQAARHVTITVITPGRIVQLTDLTPDQLLDLQADNDPGS